MVWREGLVPWAIFLLSAAVIIYAERNCPIMATRLRNSPQRLPILLRNGSEGVLGRAS